VTHGAKLSHLTSSLKMGLIYATITLSNPKLDSLQPITTKALVDTGALHLCIPEHIALQLNLTTLELREATLADGKKYKIPYAGPLLVQFETRSAFVGAMILGDEVLLGAIPMEDLDVVVHPASQTLKLNPESPNMAMSQVK
jgi:clan AA aspartic protease